MTSPVTLGWLHVLTGDLSPGGTAAAPRLRRKSGEWGEPVVWLAHPTKMCGLLSPAGSLLSGLSCRLRSRAKGVNMSELITEVNQILDGVQPTDRDWINQSFTHVPMQEGVLRAWRKIPPADRLVLKAMGVTIVERDKVLMRGDVGCAEYEFAAYVDAGDRKPVVALSTVLRDWPVEAIAYVAGHEFAHHYLRHPWMLSLTGGGATYLRSYLEQAVIFFVTKVWGFEQEYQAAMKLLGRYTV